MFKVGDKVRYIGPKQTAIQKCLYKRKCIIDMINGPIIKVKFKFKFNNYYNTFWAKESDLQKVTPEYIQKWEKALNV